MSIVLGVCILAFLCFLFFFFSGKPGFPPVKAKGICMYFQRRVSRSLTSKALPWNAQSSFNTTVISRREMQDLLSFSQDQAAKINTLWPYKP